MRIQLIELTEKSIQNVLYRHLINKNHNHIIPNIGLFPNHEADLISATKAGYINEYEVKISRSDWKADFKKSKFKLLKENYVERRHKKNIDRYGYRVPNYFWYVVPEELYKCSQDIVKTLPGYSGIIVVGRSNCWVKYIRKAKLLHRYKINESQKEKITRGLTFRYWNTRI